jgi:hypothetical protein
MKSPRKPKANEPSAKDKLSADFTQRLEKKWREQGDDVLEAAFKESPTKIAEMIARLVMTTEPKAEGYESAKNMEDIGRKLLQSVGFTDPDPASIEAAIKANNIFIDGLQQIRAEAEGAIQ